MIMIGYQKTTAFASNKGVIMHEKIRMVLIFSVCVFCIIGAVGCKSSPAQSADTQSVSREGYIAVGRLDQLGRDAQGIQQRFEVELDSIGRTASDLGTTIHELINFSQRLLNEYESLQRQIAAIAKGESDLVADPHNLDSP